MRSACKRPGPQVVIEWHGGILRARSQLHPRGCMGASRPHLDVELPRDPCGLRAFLSRGGHRVRARRLGSELVVDLSRLLGYPCMIRIEGAPGFLGGKVYVMVSRSGRLYVAPA